MIYRIDDITSENLYRRRRFLKKAALLSASALAPTTAFSSGKEEPTPFKAITHYNNYLEFSPEKEAVAFLAQELKTEPWTLSITGEVEAPIECDVEKIRSIGEEERVYPLRCVEGWSMIIPWTGVPLNKVLSLVKPLPSARFVEFISLYRPKEMIGQRRPVLEWPYREALRIDEAMHPLTLLATGLYGKSLPKQNGAPLRLVVPWKYGFKSAKAIVSIHFTKEQPTTTWMKAAPSEYGFYANVNPEVAHPRWSQRRELRIGESKKRRTLSFNGFADEVSQLYQGMDLHTHF